MQPIEAATPLLMALNISPILLLATTQLDFQRPAAKNWIEVNTYYRTLLKNINLFFQIYRFFGVQRPSILQNTESAIHQLVFKLSIGQSISKVLAEFATSWKSIKESHVDKLEKTEVKDFFSLLTFIGI